MAGARHHRKSTVPGSFVSLIFVRPLREHAGSSARTGTGTAACQPTAASGPSGWERSLPPERTDLHDAERDRVPALRVLSPSDVDQQALLDEWVLRQRADGLSEKTIRERVGVIGRLSNAANLTAVDVERFLANQAWARSTRATYHGAIRAWSLWLIRTGRRPDDPTLIATTPKTPKGRPRPVADEHLTVLLSTRMSGRTRAM